MPSPFPGMNPWLERSASWTSFHTNFIVGCQNHLAPLIRPKYFIDVETRLYLHNPPTDPWFLGRSDVAVLSESPRAPSESSTALVEAPIELIFPEPVDFEKVHYLAIRDRENQEVVTVIELLSRANKYAGEDREQYLHKRLEIMKSASHFVEIDLLRGGPQMPPPDLPTCDYCAIVSRVGQRPRLGVWSWRLREAIPKIPIPLRAPDADVLLDIKSVIDRLYDQSSLADRVYSGVPEPRLTPDDMAWAAQFLPSPTA